MRRKMGITVRMTDKNRLYKTTAILFTVIFLTICPALCRAETVSGTDPKGRYSIWYLDASETGLKAAAYEPDAENKEAMVPELIGLLNGTETPSGCRRLLPDDVSILDSGMEGEVLILSFGPEYKTAGIAREVLARTGLVQPFPRVPGVRAVRIESDGQPLTDSKGNPLGDMTPDTFADLGVTDKEPYHYGTFTLYFTDKDGTMLLPETRTVYYKSSIPRARVALEQLADGPMEKDHYPTIPEDTTLLTVTDIDGVCYADFDRLFISHALNLPDEIVLYSVANTVIAATGAEKAEILVDGNTDAVFGAGETSLYTFFRWNEELIGAVPVGEAAESAG